MEDKVLTSPGSQCAGISERALFRPPQTTCDEWDSGCVTGQCRCRQLTCSQQWCKTYARVILFPFCWQGNCLWARKYLLLRPHSLNVVDSLPFQTPCTLTVVLLLKMWPRKWLEPPWNGGPLPQVDPAGLYEVTRWIWPTVRLGMCVLAPD